MMSARLLAVADRCERLLRRLESLPGGLTLQFVLLFAIVRGAHLVWAWSVPLGGDALEYDHLAWATARGEPWVNWRGPTNWQFGPEGTPTAVRTPSLPLFLAPFYAIAGHDPEVGRTALVAFNAVAAGALFHASRKMWGLLAAASVSLLWVFWPVSVRALYYVDSLLGESLAVPLIIFALWGLTRERLRFAALAGAAFAGAILARPHLSLAVPVFVLICALTLWRDSAARTRVAVCLGVCCLCFVPWILRNQAAFGKPMPLSSQGGLGLWIGWAEGTTGTWNDRPHEKRLVTELAERHPEILTGPEPRKSEIYSKVAREEIEQRGVGGVAKRALLKAWFYVRPWEFKYGLHSALLLSMVLAAAAGRALWATPAAALATSVYVGLLLTSVVTFYLGRYRFVATPALLFLAGAGLRSLHARLASRASSTPARAGDTAGA